LNAVDYAGGTTRDRDATVDADLPLKHFLEVASWGSVDFIEISGGDYENPEFMDNLRPSSGRQALFSSFSHRAMDALTSLPPETQRTAPLVLLTGGLKTPSQCASVLENGHAHLLGIGRSSIVCPDFPHRVLGSIRDDTSDPTFDIPRPILNEAPGTLHLRSSVLDRTWGHVSHLVGFPKLIGAGMEMAWYTVMMRRIAAGQRVDLHVGGVGAVMRMWLWKAPASRYSATFTAWLSVFFLVMATLVLLFQRAMWS